MKAVLNTIAVLFIAAAFIGFMALFGHIWDHKEKYQFEIGILSCIGWLGIGALIVVWVVKLTKK